MPKENHGKQSVRCKASRAQIEMPVPPVLGKEGILSLVFGQHRFGDGAFLFRLVASFKPRRNFADSLNRSIFDAGGKCKENKYEDDSDRTGCHSSCRNR